MTGILYHGSPKKLDKLVPVHSKLTQSDVVYASQYLAVALCFACNLWTDEDIELGTYGDELYLEELKPGAFVKAFDASGWVYEVPKAGFENHPNLGNFEFVSTKVVVPTKVIQINNVLKAIKATDVTLIRK